MLPSSWFVRGFCHVHVGIKTVCLTIVLSSNSSKNCRGVSHTPSMAAWLHVRRGYFVRRYHSVFAHVRAYAIRPYTCSIDFWDMLGCVSVPFSPTSGRMRYAPTPVRVKSWLNMVYIYTCSMIVVALQSENIRPNPPHQANKAHIISS